MPLFRGQRELTNRQKLVLAIHKNAQNDPMRQADIEQCRKEVGLDENTFLGLVDELETLGFLVPWRGLSVGSIKLSATGLLEAEKLSKRQ